MPSRWIQKFVVVFYLFLTSGCGEATVKTYPVSGIVVFEDGQPVPFGVVEFRTVGSAPVARGKIGKDGRFTLGTFADDDGAVAGKHKIIVVQHALIDRAVNDPDQAGKHRSHKSALVDPKFATYETSGLTAEVKSDSKNFQKLSVIRFSVEKQKSR